MSERFMTQDQYVRLDSLLRPVPTPEQAIAAELDAILAHLTFVIGNATSRLDGPENHELFLAWKGISDLAAALRS